jgi:hypothetical protein
VPHAEDAHAWFDPSLVADDNSPEADARLADLGPPVNLEISAMEPRFMDELQGAQHRREIAAPSSVRISMAPTQGRTSLADSTGPTSACTCERL